VSYDGTSVLDEILQRGALRIAVEFNDPPDSGFPPEMYIDPESGKPWGIGPIIGGLIAEDLGVDLECVDLPWPEHVDALLDGRVDLLPKHVNTPERALRIEFASGRLNAYRVTALIPVGSDLTKARLDQEDVVITSWHGSSTTQVAQKHFPNATTKEFKKPHIEVVEGRAHACVTDSITHIFLEKNPELELMREHGKLVVLSREYVHPSIKPDDPKFLNWLNNWLEYHEAQGTRRYWCEEWWESFMADQED
jgi:polar amino acid transport system substrate-binding protein